MTTLQAFLILFFFLSTPSAAVTCKKSSCPSLQDSTIRFPFRLNQTQPQLCGYPGFDLSCNDRGQAIINLQSSGEFVVNEIDYRSSKFTINDPTNCMPKRWLNCPNNLSYMFHPFQVQEYFDTLTYTFLNCTSDITTLISTTPNIFTPIPCLSGDSYAVWAIFSDDYHESLPCIVLSKVVQVPLRASYNVDATKSIYEDVFLTWTDPDCHTCEGGGGTCKYKSDKDLEIGCVYRSRILQYCLAIGIVICSLLCLAVILAHVFIKARDDSTDRSWDHSRRSIDLTGSVAVKTGLDRVVVDSYPKTKFGEIKDLGDNTCSICLSEYEAGEILRTIPSCEHSFHVNCIDEWLMKNDTCPLCRNLAHGSFLGFPRTSLSPRFT